MIAKKCRPALVVAAALVIGVGGTPTTASAHDCHGGWGVTSVVLDDHGDHHGDCPNPQPAVGGGAYAPYPAPGVAPAVTPLPAGMGDAAALAPPAVPQAAPATPVPPNPAGASAAGRAAVQRVVAGSSVTGGSWLPLALFCLFGLALIALIRAGFRARRAIGAGLEARWPR